MRKRKAHFWGIYSITNRIIRRLTLALLVSVFGFTITASAQSGKARHSLGNPAELKGWTGLEKAAGADAAKLAVPGEAKFLYQAEDGDPIGWEATEGRFRRFDPAEDTPILEGGKIGFRQMRGLIADYANLQVRRVERK